MKHIYTSTCSIIVVIRRCGIPPSVVDVPFPCSDPVNAGNAGNSPAGIAYSFGVHGIWEIDNSTGSYSAGTENHRKTDIFMGIVWMGMGN